MTISDNIFTHNSGSEQSGGIKNIRIDFTAIAGITDAHLRIAEALQFPDHYGKNLDALFDCLAEICKPVAVTLFGTSALTAVLGSYGSIRTRQPKTRIFPLKLPISFIAFDLLKFQCFGFKTEAADRIFPVCLLPNIRN